MTYLERIQALLNGSNRSDLLSARLQSAAETHGDRVAFDDGSSTLTFAETLGRARALASSLYRAYSMRPGDRVAVMLPNCCEFPIATFASLLSGVVQVNVNPNYTSRELRHQLQDSGPKVIIVSAAQLPVVEEVRSDMDDLSIIIVGSVSDDSPYSDFDLLSHGTEDIDLDFADHEPRAEDLAFLQYTGGTTGRSKGAQLTLGNVSANLLQFEHHLDGLLDDAPGSVFTALPLYHVFALMVNGISGFCFGLTNMLIRNPRDTDRIIAALKGHPTSLLTGVNALFDGICALPDSSDMDWTRLRLVLGGGTKIFSATARRWHAMSGSHIRVGYGLSETSPIVSMHDLHQAGFAEHAGRPLIATEVKLLDHDDVEAETGAPGEVCIRGPQVMRGYWRREHETAIHFTKDGFFRTGDIACRDEEGHLDIVDRKKDMILVSGFNVYPNEVEAVIAEHPNVAECMCVGVPDDRTGEAVKAFIVGRRGGLETQDLSQFLKTRLTAYKIPKQFEFRDDLPKSAVGKPLRRELRDASLS